MNTFTKYESKDGLRVEYVCPTFSVQVLCSQSGRAPGKQFYEDIECLIEQEAKLRIRKSEDVK